MIKDKYLLVIAGPTAVGKTSFAIQVAKSHQAEIFSADSRQFYREMSIGTAKPNKLELAAAKHHFIDNLSISSQYSVGDYEKECLVALESYFKEKDLAILCGGTGLFIKAVCEGLDKFPIVPPSFRENLTLEFQQNGIEKLQEELKESDPAYYAQTDLQNPHRIIRALEVIRFSKKPFMSFWNKNKVDRPFKVLKIALEMEREELYNRINERVELMFSAGLLEEAKSLLPYRNQNALNTVGYKELFDYFEGKTGLEEAKELIKRNSRRYAKRQMTWFRNQGDFHKYDSSDIEGVSKLIADQIH